MEPEESDGSLKVGTYGWYLKDDEAIQLLPVFLDSMYHHRVLSAGEYYGARIEGVDARARLVEVNEFRAPGDIITDRMDLIGYDEESILEALDGLFEGYVTSESEKSAMSAETRSRVEEQEVLISSLDGRQWVSFLRSSPSEIDADRPPSLNNRYWLLERLWPADIMTKLRAVLLAFPNNEVVLDVTQLWRLWWEDLPGPQSLPSAVGTKDPVIVLTEGTTDAEFLSSALKVIYPHLVDLIRFLDYGQKPEGGAGAAVNMLKAFAAAGVTNRVIAALDNDTAAMSAIHALRQVSLPSRMKVITYPDIHLASQYPTLGPPTLTVPQGQISAADVNGHAAGIELYLGKDVLTGADGKFVPIQWTSFMSGVQRYQGQLQAADKSDVQKRFRDKYARAIQQPGAIVNSDWDELRLILDAIRQTAISAKP